MMNPRILFLFLLAAASFFAAAQPVRVLAKLSQDRILIGEQFQLTLQAQVPANRAMGWFDIDSFPHFEVLHRSAIDTQAVGNALILVQNIKLTSWDSGRWNLPVFSLPGSNRSQPPAVTVSFSPMDPNQKYHEVKDVLEVSRPGSPSWYWYLILAALLLLFVFIVFPGKGRKNKMAAPAPEKAYREVMKQLEALEKKAETEDSKAFYTELIQVFRNYLGQRKNFYSASKTTSDIQAQLPEWRIQGEQARLLSDTLLLSDGVKFARFEASVAERKASLRVVRDSIVFMEKQEPAAAKA